MHNGATNTPEALPMVIEAIKAQGYEIVPISQILLKGNYTTDVVLDQAVNAVKGDSSVVSDNPSAAVGIRKAGNDVTGEGGLD